MANRQLLFWVFALASGIAFYFVLPFEPEIRFPILISILSILCFAKYKNFIFLFIFGFFYSVFRTDMIDTKLLKYSAKNQQITGVIQNIDFASYKDKIFVKREDGNIFRISVPHNQNCKTGEQINITANLYAPSGVDAFNKFDYARYSFFNSISGNGTLISGSCSGYGNIGIREKIHNTANNKLVDSLVLGYKDAITTSDYNSAKVAGIAHIFSISGFHIALIGGWLYLLFYNLIRIFPKIIKRIPAKIIAIPPTAIGLLFYLILSGSDVATIRAFIMATVGFVAVMLGRNVLTLRNAAIVFGIMIIAKPFWLVSAGFQLSFAAIFGLLYFFENRKYGFIKTLLVSTGIATLWTLPFIAYHFGTFPIYGLLGNLIALPLFSFLIMPLVFIGTALSFFGIRFPLNWSDYLYKNVIDLCNSIKDLPFSSIAVPDIESFILFIVFAGMFLFLIGNKKLSVWIFLISVIYIYSKPMPILRTTSDREVVGFVQSGKTYYNAKYSEKRPFIIPRSEVLKADCKSGFCEYKTKNWTAVSIQRFLPLYKNIEKLCNYDFIISVLPIKISNCKSKIIYGSVKIYENGRVQNVKYMRIWHLTH